MRASRLISHPLRWAALVAVAALAALPTGAAGRGHHHGHKLAGYQQRNLVADTPGAAEITDPNLVNAWGLSFGPSTPAWVADNGTGVSTLYSGANSTSHAATIVPLVVTIPQGHRPARCSTAATASPSTEAHRASCSPQRRA